MTIRNLLLVVPLVLMLFLLQSCLWVPTYFSPDRGNTKRDNSFVRAAIGDAKLLNPIVSSDSASSSIEDLVFEGLIGTDENSALVPELAKSWQVTERVLLIPPGGNATKWRRIVEQWVADKAPDSLRSLVTAIDVAPETVRSFQPKQPEGAADLPAAIEVTVGPRVRLHLSKVVPDVADLLTGLVRGNVRQIVTLPDTVTLKDEELADVIASIEHNPVVSFQLRNNVRFHDGHPFDASDVVFTWRAFMNPKNLSPRVSSFEPISDIEVVDPYEIRVIYKRLYSPAVLSWALGILPEHLVGPDALAREMDERGLSPEERKKFGMRDTAFNRNPVGTGPYRFVEWSSDELIRLKANKNYWGEQPGLERYVVRIIPDGLIRELETTAGVLDVYSPEPYQVERFRKDRRFNALTLPGDGYSYIAYNQRQPRFADLRVRRALAMAIDMEPIIRYVLYGEGERATGPYPLTTRWHDSGIAAIPYDPTGAEKLLEEAGYARNSDGLMEKDGKILEFNLITNQGNPIRKSIMSIAQDAWKRIGVKCNTQVIEWAVFLEDFVNPGKFDALVLGWKMGIDPDLYQLWHSSQTGFGQLNFTGYNNPKIDRIIEQIRAEYDENEQERLAHQLHAIIARDQPYTFLFAPGKNVVLNKRLRERLPDNTVGDVRASPNGEFFQHFTRWTKATLTPSVTGG